MSINNLNKPFENKVFLYCILNNKIIIECDPLYIVFKNNFVFNDIRFEYFICDKIKIITIYDIYKNIIVEPIQINIFKDPIKIGGILEKLKEKYIYFSKTLSGAVIANNTILNNEIYITNYKPLIEILDYNTHINLLNYVKYFSINDNEGNCLYKYNTRTKYCVNNIKRFRKHGLIYHTTSNNYGINIIKENYSLIQKIDCYFNFKIHKILEYYKNNVIYYEKRNNNNEIIIFKNYDNNKIIEKEFISNNKNPPFSKPLKKIYIELVNCYKKNINNYNKLIFFLCKKEKELHNNLLERYYLEIIKSK